MNKILIVGHPASGYQDVEALLHACGMAKAQPSRREGFLPGQISETLCKAHSVIPLKDREQGQTVRQIQPGPVWHGMALDLMLGNFEQPLWGWADPQAIYLLDYWRDLDPSIHFILVYDHPHTLLTRASLEQGTTPTAEGLAELARTWATYNGAMLHFFHRNAGRCLLVHSGQVRASTNRYLQQVRARIQAPWAELVEFVVGDLPSDTAPHRESWMEAVNHSSQVADSELALFIAGAITRQLPEAIALYEELQASANLPLMDEAQPSGTDHAALRAWQAMARLQQANTQAQGDLSAHAEALEIERAAWQCNVAQIEQRARESADAAARSLELQANRLDELSAVAQTQLKKLNAAEQQLSALATQLAEESGARHRAEKSLGHCRKQLEDATARLTEAQREKEAAARIEAAGTDHGPRRSTEASTEIELLVAQLLHVQEELERFYVENLTLKSAASSELHDRPSGPQPAQGLPALYGAADRVKQELPYRLGATLIRRSRNARGWIGLPLAIVRVFREYKSTHRQASTLPPITSYADAGEADRVRQHLSYRLGQAFLDNLRGPGGWVRLPIALRNEVRLFRSGRVSAR